MNQLNRSLNFWTQNFIFDFLNSEKVREQVQETPKIEFPKIEKILNHFKTTDGLCPDKICVGDLAIVAIHVASVYFQNEEDFKTLIPSAQPLVHRLLQNDRLAAHVE